MYHFAVVVLLGLAALKIADLFEDLVPAISRMRTLLIFAVALTAAVVIDYSLFGGYGITLRDAWMGPWVTGLVIGSVAAAWRSVLGYLGHEEREGVEARRTGRPRVAA